jgi:hypothetical protein
MYLCDSPQLLFATFLTRLQDRDHEHSCSAHKRAKTSHIITVAYRLHLTTRVYLKYCCSRGSPDQPLRRRHCGRQSSPTDVETAHANDLALHGPDGYQRSDTTIISVSDG